ncbi:MAG: FimB/Mfa2 family fimbrial subunit [Tannerellaceae bacterium]
MIKRVLLYIIPMLLILGGCTREDLSECVQGVRLRFTHLLNNQNANLFGAKVKAVTVFVFDSDKKYVETYTSRGIKLSNDYVMDLPLRSGSYEIIVLGGDLQGYKYGEMTNSQHTQFNSILKKGVTTIDQFSFLIDVAYTDANNIIIENKLTDLFHGSLTKVIVPPGRYIDATVDLIQDTKRVNVNITGLEYFPSPNLTKTIDYSSIINVLTTARNGRYKNDNTIDPYALPFTYTYHDPILVRDTFKMNTVVLRLMVHADESRLRVLSKNSQNMLYDKNMVEQILKNPKYQTQTDLDREDEFTFDIKFTANGSIGVTINGWTIIEVAPVK